MYKPYRIFYLYIILIVINFSSCKNDFENYSTNTQDLLTFSIDTLSFDTVLTTVNSPALSFMVYNKNSKPLLISSVQLAGGANSNFKINVDGMAGSSFENVEISAKDSLLVLVNVKPKENGQYTPALFNDYIVFVTNNVQQKVVLEAFGQDVYTWKGVILSTDSILDNQKPYLIYDSLVIDKNATVYIGEGSVFYMYNNAQLIVNGTVKIKGSVDKPVIFRGSRTDNMITIPYDLIPGRWGGIRFGSESYGNMLENVRIRNGSYGIVLDVSGDPFRSKLSMMNVVVTNVAGTLLQAVNCNITAENCEFSNAKDALLNIVGGYSVFTHCTFVNYYPTTINPDLGWGSSKNKTLILSNVVLNWDGKGNDYYPVIKAGFYNSIIWGKNYTSDSGISMEKSPNVDFSYLFQNCLLPNQGTNDDHFVNCLFQVDPLFQKTDLINPLTGDWYPSFDFRLKENSPARDVANPGTASQIPYDLNGFFRLTDEKPDLGAYEYH